MLTIYGRASSNNVQKVMWLVGEIGVEHERVDLGGKFGGLDIPEFRAMNPNGVVPVLRDGELIVWESHAILRYGRGEVCARAILAGRSGSAFV
jgi:glutathione S-transferase